MCKYTQVSIDFEITYIVKHDVIKYSYITSSKEIPTIKTHTYLIWLVIYTYSDIQLCNIKIVYLLYTGKKHVGPNNYVIL